MYLACLGLGKLATTAQATAAPYHCGMTTYYITRHPGAIEWAAQKGLCIDQCVPHLDPTVVRQGDTVIGSLPVNLAAQVCAVGVAYWHLSVELTAELRGRELSAMDMHTLGACIEPYLVLPQTGSCP